MATITYQCGHTATMSAEQARAVAPSGKTKLDIVCLPCKMRGVGFTVKGGYVVAGPKLATLKREQGR